MTSIGKSYGKATYLANRMTRKDGLKIRLVITAHKLWGSSGRYLCVCPNCNFVCAGSYHEISLLEKETVGGFQHFLE